MERSASDPLEGNWGVPCHRVGDKEKEANFAKRTLFTSILLKDLPEIFDGLVNDLIVLCKMHRYQPGRIL